jgi:hypothetical protein
LVVQSVICETNIEHAIYAPHQWELSALSRQNRFVMSTPHCQRQFASDNYAGICPEAWAALAEANSGPFKQAKWGGSFRSAFKGKQHHIIINRATVAENVIK